MGMVDAFLVVVRAALVSRARLAVENPALRQQLAVLKRSVRQASATASAGSTVLGVALARLDRVALLHHHRQARDGDPLAPPRVPALLALEISTEGRTATGRRRDSAR